MAQHVHKMDIVPGLLLTSMPPKLLAICSECKNVEYVEVVKNG